MNSMFFWIIILAFVVPMAMRMYRKSVNRRNQEQSFSGRYPDRFPGGGQFPGPQNKQPRDGWTQQDYIGGGFREIMGPQPLPPGQPLPPMQPLPPADQQFPAYGQPVPGQPLPDQRAEAPQQPAAPPLPRRRRPRRATAPGNLPNWTSSTATASWPWTIT
ncbi:hypothetical protein AHiyo4_15720 [Arthrobacter sp. Hiyo4]|nr:hypothetical protein AHiyo4_15720 [Arthrobacter sp. Hiyo4]